MKELHSLCRKVETADDNLMDALEKEFPILTRVCFIFMHGQRNPSTGEVIGYVGGRHGCLRVRMETMKRTVKSVPLLQILEKIPR